MRSAQVTKDPWRTTRSLAAAAQGHKFMPTGRTEPAIRTTVCCAQRSAFGRQKAVPPEKLQEILWQQFFQDTGQWWDNRRSKPGPLHPDFRHKQSKVPLWLNNRHKPVWVDSQLATIDAGSKTTLKAGCTTVGAQRKIPAIEGYVQLAVCRDLCEDGLLSDAVEALDLLVQQGCHVPSNLYYLVLKTCIQKKDFPAGMRIHALTVKSGYEGDAFLATHLIRLHASHGNLDEATVVFSKVPAPDAHNWATIIFAYARHGGAAEAAKAVRLYRRMCESSTIKPDECIYVAILKACAAARDVIAGKEVHARIVASKWQPSRFVQAGLVNMYVKCGSLEDARRLFDMLSEKDAVTWTSMIAGYAQQGMGQEALSLYSNMRQDGYTPDAVTYVCLLQACASVGATALHEGTQLHAQIEERGLEEDAVLGGSLVNMYSKCGNLKDARRLFDKLPERNVIAWNAMISGYAQQAMGQEALTLYSSMRRAGLAPDVVTYACVAQACASEGVDALPEGKQLHVQIEEQGLAKDALLGRSLVHMYVKCGSLKDARRLFDKLSDRNIVAWNTMFAGYAQQGWGQEALSLYSKMQREGLIPNSITYVSLLQACASVGEGALLVGMQLHEQMEGQGLEGDAILSGSLVNMYAKCGRLGHARRLLDKIPQRSVVAWNALIAGCAHRGTGQEAFKLYSRMLQEGLNPDSATYVGLLQACVSLGAEALHQGKQLHIEIKERGLEKDVLLDGSLVNMYAKCGSLQDARDLFDKLTSRNVVVWNAMLAGYSQQGMGREVFRLYNSMQQEGLTPDYVTYVCLLHACASVGVGALHEGKQLHARIGEQGMEEDAVLGGSLVNMYTKCGSLEDASRLFDKLSARNLVAWNAMISGYVQQGMGLEALSFYNRMQEEGPTADFVTYVCLLQACASIGVGALHRGKKLHGQIKERHKEEDSILAGSLVNMYVKCGSLEDARNLFEKLQGRNVVAWNMIIAGYAQQGLGKEAMNLYNRMRQEGLTPDSVTFVCLLQACASVGVGALHEGRQLHAQIGKRALDEDVSLIVSLINMYNKCGSIIDARRLFDKVQEMDVAAWNAMIAGYAQHGMGQEALNLYSSMQQEGLNPDSVTYVCLLQACASVGVGALHVGEQLHTQIKEKGLMKDAVLGGSLVNMYVKCGGIEDARKLFDKLPRKDVVACTAMIAGYSQQGMAQEALSLHIAMQQEGFTPNSVTYICLLQACAAVAALPLGEQLHVDIEESGLLVDGQVGAALVNMYAKCGNISASQLVFDSLCERSIESWNALVSGYARQGDSQVVFDLLGRMQSEGTHPDAITFLGVLTVCSHVGLVDKGREYFDVMRAHYGISATMEHYICMVDLLGRAGHLQEALDMAKSMPFPPSDVVWHTLLGACHKWKNVEIGLQGFKGAISLDEKDAAAYVLMSNIYASNQMWKVAKEIKARRTKLKAWKKPGQSWWTDMAGVVHTFLAGDKKHPESLGIYRRLEQLIPKMKKEGYVPCLESSLLDVPDDKKQAELCEHSEKLAIAYALNMTAEGTTIRIVKNLRVCEDCHAATAYISKVEKRTIICRDASRFHVYKDGKCSCGDYW